MNATMLLTERSEKTGRNRISIDDPIILGLKPKNT